MADLFIRRPDKSVYCKYLIHWGGTAFSSERNTNVLLLLLAHSEEEALERYHECISRHPHLKALEDPSIAHAWNVQQMIADLFNLEMKEELERYHSVEV